MRSPFRHANIRLFIAFRVLFNARFYYPVFTVLFLDMGLSLEQFLLLNAVWAATIFLLEVPSGAMADTIGRKNLVVIAAACMVLEMILLCFLPIGNTQIVFWGLLINRVLSGTAEAMASGADEALAFDTLKSVGEELNWSKVLDIQMRFGAGAMAGAMLLGGLLYDASAVTWFLALFGFSGELAPETTLRFPLYLCLGTSLFALAAACSLKEVPTEGEDARTGGASIRVATRTILETIRWVFKSPVVLLIIAAALTFDSTARTIITLASEYYRYIQIPEFAFGIIGAAGGLVGIVTPIYARRLVEARSALFNWSLLAAILGATLCAMALTIPFWGVIPVFGIGLSLTLINFFTSHYLNHAVTDSRRRATVLSIRSLATNLAYGATGLVYMGFTLALREDSKSMETDIGETSPVFGEIMAWTPAYYLLTLALLVGVVLYLRGKIAYPANLPSKS